MEWQPIETAPRTGVVILAWCERAADAPDYVAYGDCFALIYWCGRLSDWLHYWDGDPAIYYPPKHWMPLPSPPEATP